MHFIRAIKPKKSNPIKSNCIRWPMILKNVTHIKGIEVKCHLVEREL